MSTIVLDTDGVSIATFTGPAGEGPDRKRWQITDGTGEWIQLTRPQMTALAGFFGGRHTDCNPQCRHPGAEDAS